MTVEIERYLPDNERADLRERDLSSYNYARFLRHAIDSALAQTYPHTEVIVVDDGSTDDSPHIIESYGDRITSVLKKNAGQASAFNAGVRLSHGKAIVFLDSDDGLYPDAIEKAIARLREPGFSKVHWNLAIGDPDGTVHNELVRSELSEGDLRDAVLHRGADGYTWPPTSGNAWSRAFIDRAFPIPETEFNTCPDFYLATLAPLYGLVGRIATPLGFWRYHPINASFSSPFDANLQSGLRCAEKCLVVLEEHARALGLKVDRIELRRNSRWHQMQEAVQLITSTIPPKAAFILVDEDHWKTGEFLAGRRRFLFPESNGQFWGYPADDPGAIHELERLRGEGAQYIVFVWPYLWWLNNYTGLAAHLRETYRVALETDRIVIFEL